MTIEQQLHKIKILTLFIFFVLAPVLVPAQKKIGQAFLDSLLTELPRQREDTDKANLLYYIVARYLYINPEEGMKYCRTEMALSQKLGYKKGIASSFLGLGAIYEIQGNIPEAVKSEQEAIRIFRETGNKKGEADADYKMAGIEEAKGNLTEGLRMALEALRIYESIDSKYGESLVYIVIGNIYSDQENYAEAGRHYDSSRKISEATSNHEMLAVALVDIGNVDFYQGHINEALDNERKALSILEASGDKIRTASICLTIANNYDTLKDYNQALQYYRQCLEIEEAAGARTNLVFAYQSIADFYQKHRKLPEAETYYKKEVTLSSEIGDIRSMADAYASLSLFYERTGKYKQSLENFKKYMTCSDSIYNDENTKKTIQAQMQFDFDKKEAVEKAEQKKTSELLKMRLQRKNIVITAAIFAFVVLLVFSYLLIRQNRLKASEQRMELEQKQLRGQMNPHFIFNCLNSIQHFILDNDVKNANKYLSGFASLMRQTLENSREGSITLRREIEYLRNYLALELMRFEDVFTWEIACDETINKDSVEIPSMIIQPFIENAIRHGLCYLQGKKGELKVKFYQQNEHLYCEIDDNGIGRAASGKLKVSSTVVYESQGMELTRQRLALVSKSNGSDYEIEVVDKVNANKKPEGTTIIIKFPANT